jgi:hypothetical protein
MRRTHRRRLLGVALVVTAGSLALLASPAAEALDPGANASAFGATANVLNGTVKIPQTPTSTFPPGGTNSTVSLNLGTLGQVGALNATTSGNSANGTSSASGSVANVALLKTGIVSAISADAVDATCSDTAPDAPTGQTTLTNAKLGTTNVLDLHPAANTKLINLPPLAVVTLNEQKTNADGSLTVNAIHVQVGALVNGVASVADVILGSATCGPNAVTAPVDAFSFASLPIVLAGLGAVVFAGFGVRTGLRRFRARA